MGVHSSVDLTRDEAIRLIRAGLDTATQEELAGVLDAMFGDTMLWNYRVIDSYDSADCSSEVFQIEDAIQRRKDRKS